MCWRTELELVWKIWKLSCELLAEGVAVVEAWFG